MRRRLFSDRTFVSGWGSVDPEARLRTFFFDPDNDGIPDLFVANATSSTHRALQDTSPSRWSRTSTRETAAAASHA